MSVNIDFHHVQSVTLCAPVECRSGQDDNFYYRELEIRVRDHAGTEQTVTITLHSDRGVANADNLSVRA